MKFLRKLFHAEKKSCRPRILIDKKHPNPTDTPIWPFNDLVIIAKALEKAPRLVQKKKHGEAELLLQEARRHSPNNQDLLVALAHVATDVPDWPKAEWCWQAVIDLYPELHYAHGYHATAIAMQGRASEAATLYASLISSFPTDLGPPSQLAYMLESMEPAEKAIYTQPVHEALSRLRAADPRSVVALTAHARVARSQRDWCAVRDRLKLASQLASNNSVIRIELEEASRRCEESLTPTPKH